MKGILSLIFFSLIDVFLSAQELTEEKIEIFSEYAGKCIGEGFRHFKGCYNLDAVVRGLKNYEKDKESGADLSEEELRMILEIQEALFAKISAENLRRAEAFLQELAGKANVTVINEKLLYEELKPGTSKNVIDENSTPFVHYRATTIDGTEIVNTFKEDEPVELPLKETIVGFAQAAIGMKEGERRRIYIHPDLAYKKMGNLPPNSLLILELEILGISSHFSKISTTNNSP